MEQISSDKEQLLEKGKVLVMDDDQTIKKALQKILTKSGYDVEFASDGDEAIDIYIKGKASAKPFDVVIMDLTIPGGMGGREAIFRLLKIDPKVKAIVTTGYASDPILADFKKCGFSGVLVKPFGLVDVIKLLTDLIEV